MVNSITLEKDIDIDSVFYKLAGLDSLILGLTTCVRDGFVPKEDELQGLSVLVNEALHELKTLISVKSPMEALIEEAMDRIPIGKRNWTVDTPEAIEALAIMFSTIAKERRPSHAKNR